MVTNDYKYFEASDPEDCTIVPNGTCILAYRGSVAHGMYVPSTNPLSIDDVDLIGIVVPPIENYFGLSEWGTRGTKEVKEGKWDCVYYEIKKMFSLLLQGNPNVMSLLWTEPQHVVYHDGLFTTLRYCRAWFVGKHVYNAFAGYAHQQLEKMESRDPAELLKYMAITSELKYRGEHPNHKGEHTPRLDVETGVEKDVACWSTEKLLRGLFSYQKKGENIGYMGDKRKRLVLEYGYDTKNAAHCIRLLRMCKEFLLNGEMQVFRPDAADLLNIKQGMWALSDVKKHARELFEEIKWARDNSKLPAEPDRARVQALLVKILKEKLV